MTYKEHLALHDKQVADHERHIKAIWKLADKAWGIIIQTRAEARSSNARMDRIEAALEMHVRGKGRNGHAK